MKLDRGASLIPVIVSNAGRARRRPARLRWQDPWGHDVAVIDVLVDFAARRPSPHTQIGLQQMHGAAARVAPDATAFAHRHDQWDCLILAQWDRPADDAKNIEWTRACYAAMEPHLERAVYVNDLGDDEADRVGAAYGDNYGRLAAIKAMYDPDTSSGRTRTWRPRYER